MPDARLVVVDPGHFHATLVQQEMYPGVSPRVRVHAPLGPDLIDYIGRIARYNAHPRAPTDWRLDVHAGPDFLDRLRDEAPGGLAVFSGRNRGKIEGITSALEAGLHVLADKPAIIERADLDRLDAALAVAEARQLVLADMMTGRHNALARLLQALRDDPEVFGEPVAGTAEEPGVAVSSVHHLCKTVAGHSNPRPPWYFDVTQQGEGLADTAVHLVDRVHETLFPDATLDHRRDIDIVAASRWPTRVSLAQFRHLTGADIWPDDLEPWLRNDALDFFCNGRADYQVRGIHVRLEVRWDWQAEQGDDTHQALYRGTSCRLELRQGPSENFRPELYVVPEADMAAPLQHRIAALQSAYPGIAAEALGHEWRIRVPQGLRVGHDAAFAAFTRRFLADVADPAARPARERPNLIAKYYVTTESVARSRG
jgi:Putative oxidoreductase C terminal domain